MSITEFLKDVLPEGTRYALKFFNKDGVARRKFYPDINALVERDVQQAMSHGFNCYYATAGFGAGSKAEAENAVAKKELYLDVDCGQEKPHKTKAEGLTALKEFVKTMGLPRPTLIDSGNGIHAHWYFDRAIPVHEWVDMATTLKLRCDEHGFKVDGGCTADIVRVLRIPGTVNIKGGNPVTLLTPVKFFPPDDLRKILGTPPTNVVSLFNAARALTQEAGNIKTFRWDDNRSHKFELVLKRSLEGDGCNQIAYAYRESDTLTEPEWRASLSIAQYCEDRDWAIHHLSQGHPGYSSDETENKAQLVKGPYTCESFSRICDANRCTGCKHKGEITSPIQLGIFTKRAEDNKIVTDTGRIYEVPAFPWPYFRGANGGVYRTVQDEQEKEAGEPEKKKDVCVCAYDIYAFKRSNDHELGDVVWFRIHLPHQDVREFAVSQRDVASRDKLRDCVSQFGATIFNPTLVMYFQDFVRLQLIELQRKEKVTPMRMRFGWTDEDSFVVGNREYTKDGVKPIQISRTIEHLSTLMQPVGTFEKWREIVSTYDDPKYDFHAAGVLAGFGSVLMHYAPVHGAVINFYSKDSGTGKTTIQYCANSVFGHPKELMKYARDTVLTKTHRMGILNGIVACFDEMTNIAPEQASELGYGTAEGRARDRMKSDANAERHNPLTWKLLSLWSANTSMENKLSLIKADPQGEMARILEIQIRKDPNTQVLDKQLLFEQLEHNYGHASDAFLKYIIPLPDHVRSVWDQIRSFVYNWTSWSQTDRFKLNAVIAIGTAGMLCREAGIVMYNVGRIMQTLMKQIKRQARELQKGSTRASDTIAAYINRNILSLLSIDNLQLLNGLQPKVYHEPRNSLLIRYEKDIDSLFIAKKEFDKWCAEMSVNARELPRMLLEETGGEGKGIEMTQEKKRLGRGWDADFGAVVCYCIPKATASLGLEITEDVSNSQQTSDKAHSVAV